MFVGSGRPAGGSYVPAICTAGQPFEVATRYVFLASDDSSYMSGQVLHPNGGLYLARRNISKKSGVALVMPKL
ncbi:SDR family oxidoreductase [Bacillus sp. V5-8f]|uniref:SDR family oxidoreductase n=1 Tax=Bacillus sp. V5-8f TaxID=2053044 RepID=UPI001159A756|nr:SDR family oxidoreductase [Bacillus sp. V5-8f]